MLLPSKFTCKPSIEMWDTQSKPRELQQCSKFKKRNVFWSNWVPISKSTAENNWKYNHLSPSKWDLNKSEKNQQGSSAANQSEVASVHPNNIIKVFFYIKGLRWKFTFLKTESWKCFPNWGKESNLT